MNIKNYAIRLISKIPLSIRIHLFYFYKFRKILNLKHPTLYSEKIQYRKFHLKKAYSDLSDKLKVRSFISNKTNDITLIPLIGSYASINDINFNELPQKFVIKTNFGSGLNHIQIVKDKSQIDVDKIKSKFNNAFEDEYIGSILGEDQYKFIEKKIIIEELIDNNGCDIDDFKFHIFNSHEGFLQIDFDRFKKHKRNLYDLNWNKLNYDLLYTGGEYTLPLKSELDRLKNIAFKLADGFDYVRVDLYLIGETIYFGEMTFTPGSGFESFSNKNADLIYGEMWKQF